MTKTILKPTLILSVAGLMACAGTQDPQASLDPNGITVTATQLTPADCRNDLAARAADGTGGPPRSGSGKSKFLDAPVLSAQLLQETSCSGYLVEVTGSAHAESVLVSVNGREAAVSVDGQGRFGVTILIDTLANMNVTLTPISLDGSLGVAILVDVVSRVSIN